MRLYYHHFASPVVRKVRAVAFQLPLLLEEVQIDYEAAAHQRPEYRALNPNAKFPTLVDGDFVLWESNAICQYLAVQVPQSGLLPVDERLRADVARWQSWELSHFSPPAARLIGQNMLGRHVAQSAAENEKEFRRYAAVLDQHLRGKSFLVAERLTIADFSVAHLLMYAEKGKLPIGDYPEIVRWFASVEEQPGWIKSAPSH
jgi:glutathione S-transferase